MKDMTLDLNGHSITIDVDMGSTVKAPVLFYVYKEGAALTIIGDGDVIAKNDAFIVFPRGVSDGAYIYGGTFTFKNVSGHCGGFNVHDNSGAEIVLHEGVLLSNGNYYQGSDADEIHLAEGCVLEETVIDGVTWYKVVKK